MRRLDLTFSALQIPIDILAFAAAASTAYGLRTSQVFLEIRPILQSIPFGPYLFASVIFSFVWLGIFWVAGLYSLKLRRAWNELGRIILACTAGTMVIIATIFFRREITASRFLVLAIWPLTIMYVWAFRYLLRLVRKNLLRARIGHQHIVIVGQNKVAMDLAKFYEDHPVVGYSVSRVFKTWNTSAMNELERLYRQDKVEGILLADPDMPKSDSLDLIQFAEEHHLNFQYLADLFAARFTRIDISTVAGIPVIEAKPTPLDGWGRIAKRLFDITISLVVLAITGPFVLVSMLVVYLYDGHPTIFFNERIGEHGKKFNTYKIRSMWKKYCIGPQFEKTNKTNIEYEKQLIKEKSIKDGPIYKITNDPRILPFGEFIRRWSIDEFPQFVNVLKGDMSLVGPRPHQPREVEKYKSHHRRVFAIKPGITGMAQISGRSDLDFDDENRLDIWYIENWSLFLDIYILVRTPFAVLLKKGAY